MYRIASKRAYGSTGALFSVLLLGAVSSAVAEDAGPDKATLGGVIRYSGRVPQMQFGMPEEELPIDDPAARGLPFVFVGLRPVGEVATPEYEMPDPVPAPVMDQVNFRFLPKVLAVREGQLVVFGNADGTNHNIRAASDNPDNTFNIITRPGHTYEERFLKQSTEAPIRLACDFHPSMEAWIYVVDYPYFAVTDSDGRFEIKAPAGEYELIVRDPDFRLRAESSVSLSAGASISVDTTFGIPHRYYRSSPPLHVRPSED